MLDSERDGVVREAITQPTTDNFSDNILDFGVGAELKIIDFLLSDQSLKAQHMAGGWRVVRRDS